MRAFVPALAVCGLALLACGRPETPSADGGEGAPSEASPLAEAAGSVVGSGAGLVGGPPAGPEEAELPPTDAELLARAMAEIEAEAGATDTGATDTGATDTGATDTEAETGTGVGGGEAGDAGETGAGGSLEPEVHAGPEPGSPESDAELAALLDDSTITQDEFDAAFGGGKGPKIDGDALVFGAGDRTRGRPKVELSGVEVISGGVTATHLRGLFDQERHQFEACLGMALRKDEDQPLGSTTLTLEWKGGAGVASVGGDGALGEPLEACLRSVAQPWKSGASAAKAELTLKLTTILDG